MKSLSSNLVTVLRCLRNVMTKVSKESYNSFKTWESSSEFSHKKSLLLSEESVGNTLSPEPRTSNERDFMLTRETLSMELRKRTENPIPIDSSLVPNLHNRDSRL